jgi:hypothetical protein
MHSLHVVGDMAYAHSQTLKVKLSWASLAAQHTANQSSEEQHAVPRRADAKLPVRRFAP